MKIKKIACWLLSGSCLVALSTAAVAQTADDGVESVVVTGSRLNLASYAQPTPVTVVSAADLQRDANTDIGDTLHALPSVGVSTSPNTSQGSQSQSNGSAGSNLVNLRNLGTVRTLVLFDGKRVVASDPSGGVDLNLLPASLVQRIDVVTGGASAAWGSDAVAGVVNVILNKNFDGTYVNMEGAINAPLGTRQTGKAEISYGTDLFGGKAHLILSGSWLNSPDTVVPQRTTWYRSSALVNNPAATATNGLPTLIHADHVGMSSATIGGLITSGPLKGIQFLQGGQPAPFNFGNVSGTLSNGGSAPDSAMSGNVDDLAIPIHTYTFFGHLAFDLLSNVRATVEFNYGKTVTDNNGGTYSRLGNLTITADNPYIPPSVLAQMNTARITSFPIGTTNVNDCNPAVDDLNIDDACLGNAGDHVDRQLVRGLVNLDGTFGDWNWNANFQHSQVRRHTLMRNDPVIAYYNNAADAVVAPAGNSAGIAPGSIVCRSTLTNPGNGCQPLNVMGIGVASQAAINYVDSGPGWDLLYLSEDSGGGSLQGQPFQAWAGPVSVATGFEYRKESVVQTADPLSYARGYAVGNFQPLLAHYSTVEGFGEVEVPLLKDQFVQSLDFNSAGRITSYSTSGIVETWKLGLTSQVNEDVRLRVTWSSDIRAPTLTDLFNSGSSSNQTVSDPFRNNVSTNIYAVSVGNPNLKPEHATTTSGGIVLTPHWIPGLSISADWYSINIKGAISSYSFSTVLSQCAAGVQVFCPSIIRDGNGVITQILTGPLNAASATTSGLDFQADYTQDLFGGTLTSGLTGNYNDEQTTTSLGITTDIAGSLGMEPGNGGGVPKFRATLFANYQEGRYSGTVQLRGIGAGKIDNAFGPKDIDNNDIDPVGYLDLRGSYYLADDNQIQLYAAIDNVLNTPPPNIPHSTAVGVSYFYVPTRTDIYDAIGRTVRFGARVRF